MMRWKLKDYLEQNELSAYALIKAADVAPNTVYGITRGEHERVSLVVLDKVIAGLELLTGRHVDMNDLLERDDAAPDAQPEKRGWLELAGTFDDPTSPGDIAARHDDYLGEALLDEHREGLEGKR